MKGKAHNNHVKKFLRLFVLGIFVLACGCSGNSATFVPEPTVRDDGDFVCAAWIATAWGIDFPNAPTTNSAALKSDLDAIVQSAAAMNLNTLFFQVRPCADAFYRSNLFPWSHFLTNQQGTAPANNFDPLEYIVGRCHDAGIALHAWINPYRVTTLAADTPIPSHPAAVRPDLTFSVGGKLYFNPGEPAARELIIDGVREIVENYAVDGIHFDDYFYPEGIGAQDAATFAARLDENLSLADWRRENVNRLVRDTYAAVKQIDPAVEFGISPSGIWANLSGANPLGSETAGFESLNAIYADSRAWVKNGWVDYIAPQIYWKVGQAGSDFRVLVDWWEKVCSGTGVALYVGLAGYRNFPRAEYENQIALAEAKADGFIVFSFWDCGEVV